MMDLIDSLRVCTWCSCRVKPPTLQVLVSLFSSLWHSEFSFPSLLHHPLKLHVKYGRVQDDAAVWVVFVLKGQRQRRRLDSRFGPLLLFLLQSYRQRVTVDIIDLWVVSCCFWFSEECQRIDEASRPLHRFNRHRVQRMALGHCTLIHLGSFQLPGEEDDTAYSKWLKIHMSLFGVWISSSFSRRITNTLII